MNWALKVIGITGTEKFSRTFESQAERDWFVQGFICGVPHGSKQIKPVEKDMGEGLTKITLFW